MHSHLYHETTHFTQEENDVRAISEQIYPTKGNTKI